MYRGFLEVAINNDGIKDFVIETYSAAMDLNETVIINGANGEKFAEIHGEIHTSQSLQRNTVTGEIVLRTTHGWGMTPGNSYYSPVSGDELYSRVTHYGEQDDNGNYIETYEETIYREGFKPEEYESFDYPSVSLEEIKLQEFLAYVHDNMA